MSKQNDSMILNRLARKYAKEMTRDELTQLLDHELSKPGQQMDMELVSEILSILYPDAPSPERKAAALAEAKKRLPARQTRSRFTRMLPQLTAAAAALLVILLATAPEAGAFRWTLIHKVIQPVAETFGIIVGQEADDGSDYIDIHEELVCDSPTVQESYSAWEDIPRAYEGYALRPEALPEGYHLDSATRFSCFDSEIYSLAFSKDECWFNLNTYVFTNPDCASRITFERTLDIPYEQQIGKYDVTFYSNADDHVQSAFWIYESVQYLLMGEAPMETFISILQNMQ